ncbi:MAG: hypothetical protein A2275_08510 [Bacteroidetes bacterium RIFOXYA12_FULL_35_11]|nr:MAG: hypothetical protein A2X01_09325 [Bacteroidetes bacterium GWF2_35_48]OFY75970.1 MAG: hypothetical protein A2275_08510 [Bacteroidetes bacterium RIFOXYA12_FULL_35_11]OFY93591.1 MAG: hypothetical protein A2491_00980 [Bacteroidetes bacterium RIFOXYC12_FULL_35_7]
MLLRKSELETIFELKISRHYFGIKINNAYGINKIIILSVCKKTSIIRTSWLKHSQGVCPVTLDLKNSHVH